MQDPNQRAESQPVLSVLRMVLCQIGPSDKCGQAGVGIAAIEQARIPQMPLACSLCHSLGEDQGYPHIAAPQQVSQTSRPVWHSLLRWFRHFLLLFCVMIAMMLVLILCKAGFLKIKGSQTIGTDVHKATAQLATVQEAIQSAAAMQ